MFPAQASHGYKTLVPQLTHSGILSAPRSYMGSANECNDRRKGIAFYCPINWRIKL